MARHAQARNVVELKGADKKNPQRYRGIVPESDLPLGLPPEHMSEEAQECWWEISHYSIPGVMTGADRLALEALSNYLAEYRDNPQEFAVGKMGHMIGLCARFGMSPADRNKLAIDKPNKKNPFESLDE